MKMKRKMLTGFLSVLMLFALTWPAAANAYAGYGLEQAGDNISVDISNESLNLYGEGAMYDYSGGGQPWEGMSADIEELHIGNGITYLGNKAFCLPNLKTVWIPSTVTKIHKNAFKGTLISTIYYRGRKSGFDQLLAGMDKSGAAYACLSKTEPSCFDSGPNVYVLRLDERDSAGLPCKTMKQSYSANWAFVELMISGPAYLKPEISEDTFPMDLGRDGTNDLNIYLKDGKYFDACYMIAEGGAPGVYGYELDYLQSASTMMGLYDEHVPFWHYIGVVIPTGLKNNVTVSLEPDTFVYAGKKNKPVVTVMEEDGSLLVPGTDYKVSYSKNIKAGTAKATVKGIGDYYGKVTAKFKIEKANNTLSAKGNTVSLSYSKLKKADQKLAVSKTLSFADQGGGDLTYKLSSAKKDGESFKDYFKVNKTTGRMTVKKGLAKGTYTVKIKVTASGSNNYNAGSKTVSVKIKVK